MVRSFNPAPAEAGARRVRAGCSCRHSPTSRRRGDERARDQHAVSGGERPSTTSGPSRLLRQSAGKHNRTCCGCASIPRLGTIGLGGTYYLPGAVERRRPRPGCRPVPGRAGRAQFRSYGRPFSRARTSLALPGRKCAPCRRSIWRYGTHSANLPGCPFTSYSGAPAVIRSRLTTRVSTPAPPRLGPRPRRAGGPGRGAPRSWLFRDESMALGQVPPQLHRVGSTGPAGWSAMGPVGSHLSLSDLATGLSVLELLATV